MGAWNNRFSNILMALSFLAGACSSQEPTSSDIAAEVSIVDSETSPNCPGSATCGCQTEADCPAWSTCALDASGYHCASKCQQGSCDTGQTCVAIAKSDASGKSIGTFNLCLYAWPHQCDPCTSSGQCGMPGSSAGACVDVAGDQGKSGWFCAATCSTAADCPAGWDCGNATDIDGGQGKRCLAANRQCSCGPASDGRSTSCQATASTNPSCISQRSCKAGQLSVCEPPNTASETCDGVDQDCNGLTDDGPSSSCDDGNPCTDDSCTGTKGCVHLPNAVTCSDGDACTGSDQCAAGL